MRVRIVLAVIVVLAVVGAAAAQTITGTVSGRVLDVQGAALPGATVTAKSPNLQGSREAVTSENGDYILTGLPSGPYTIAVSLSGFQTHTRSVVLAPTQVLPLEVTLGPAQVTEEVTVVGNAADTLMKTAQIATNFSQDLIANLPTSRDLNSILLMAPGVHPTGPAGAFSFGGSVTFENLFLLNGVSINENIRGPSIPRSKTRSRKPPSPTAASPPSSAGSAAAWSTSSPSRAATSSREASASHSTTTNGGR